MKLQSYYHGRSQHKKEQVRWFIIQLKGLLKFKLFPHKGVVCTGVLFKADSESINQATSINVVFTEISILSLDLLKSPS